MVQQTARLRGQSAASRAPGPDPQHPVVHATGSSPPRRPKPAWGGRRGSWGRAPGSGGTGPHACWPCICGLPVAGSRAEGGGSQWGRLHGASPPRAGDAAGAAQVPCEQGLGRRGLPRAAPQDGPQLLAGSSASASGSPSFRGAKEIEQDREVAGTERGQGRRPGPPDAAAVEPPGPRGRGTGQASRGRSCIPRRAVTGPEHRPGQDPRQRALGVRAQGLDPLAQLGGAPSSHTVHPAARGAGMRAWNTRVPGAGVPGTATAVAVVVPPGPWLGQDSWEGQELAHLGWGLLKDPSSWEGGVSEHTSGARPRPPPHPQLKQLPSPKCARKTPGRPSVPVILLIFFFFFCSKIGQFLPAPDPSTHPGRSPFAAN